MRGPVLIAAIAALTCAIPAHAVTLSYTDFETFTTGISVNGQGGWGVAGTWDERVVNDGGNIVWRVSNATTAGSFGDMPFAPRPGGIVTDTVANPANGAPASFAGQSSTGAAYNRFYAEFLVRSATGAAQTGARITVSPDNGQGARQGFLAIRDDGTGLSIDAVNVDAGGNFGSLFAIASGLSYTAYHKLGVELLFGDGAFDDVANYYVNGALVHTDKSWETFYTNFQSALHPLGVPVQTLIFRLSGTPTGTTGGGFYIDDVLIQASAVPEPGALVLVAVGAALLGFSRSRARRR